ncbi:MAG: glycosyltransferase family 2 protein [Candidatus Nanohalobium sp.]
MPEKRYTVAACNYNMAETLEESLKSILNQLDESFEVLVIDDGSTDGSQEILDRLENEYEIFRWIEGDNENIGEARAQANQEAKGEYILPQLDMDDKYHPVIEDFIQIFEKLNNIIDKEFYLAGGGLNIGPKTLLTDINYRSLGYGEDKDFWRRLLSNNSMIILDIHNAYDSIGYNYSRLDRLRISYEVTKNNFKSGVTFSSFVNWKIKNLNHVDDYFKLIISPLAFLRAIQEGKYTQPEGYENMGRLFKDLNEEKFTVSELEEKYNFEIKEKLSEEGKEILYL